MKKQKPISITVEEAIAINRFAAHRPHPTTGEFFNGEFSNPEMHDVLNSTGIPGCAPDEENDLEPLRYRLNRAGFHAEDPMPNVVDASVKKAPRSRSAKRKVFGVDVAVLVSFTRELSIVGDFHEYTVRESPYITIKAPTLVNLLSKLGDKLRIEHTSEFSGMTDGSEPVPDDQRVVSIDSFFARSILKDRSTRRITYHAADENDPEHISVSDACDHYRIDLASTPTSVQRREMRRRERQEAVSG